MKNMDGRDGEIPPKGSLRENSRPVFLSGCRDSNPGPPAPKAGALAGLRYIPNKTNAISLMVPALFLKDLHRPSVARPVSHGIYEDCRGTPKGLAKRWCPTLNVVAYWCFCYIFPARNLTSMCGEPTSQALRFHRTWSARSDEVEVASISQSSDRTMIVR